MRPRSSWRADKTCYWRHLLPHYASQLIPRERLFTQSAGYSALNNCSLWEESYFDKCRCTMIRARLWKTSWAALHPEKKPFYNMFSSKTRQDDFRTFRTPLVLAWLSPPANLSLSYIYSHCSFGKGSVTFIRVWYWRMFLYLPGKMKESKGSLCN